MSFILVWNNLNGMEEKDRKSMMRASFRYQFGHFARDLFPYPKIPTPLKFSKNMGLSISSGSFSTSLDRRRHFRTIQFLSCKIKWWHCNKQFVVWTRIIQTLLSTFIFTFPFFENTESKGWKKISHYSLSLFLLLIFPILSCPK